MAEKSSWDQATDGKNLVWFGEIEKKLTKYQRLLSLTVLPLNYFMFLSLDSLCAVSRGFVCIS
jgi:hypothetical protein